MKKSKWLILFSIVVLCVGALGPGMALADSSPPLTGRDVDSVREFNRAPSQTTAACTVPSAGYATITAALADPACDPINVNAGTYAENLTIERPVTIQGAGAVSTTVDGGGISAVFLITNTATVTLTGLTIQNGTGILDPVYGLSGGGVCNWNGNVTLKDSTIYSNTAAWGGGFYNIGTAHIENTEIISNAVSSGGGAIYNSSEIILVNSALMYNDALHGGGIQNQKSAIISNTQIAGNLSNFRGGGVFNLGGAVFIDDSQIGYNGSRVSGGGVENAVSANRSTNMVINHSEIISNTTSSEGYGGGGVLNVSDDNLTATLTINGSLISYNAANGNAALNTGTGGGIWNTFSVPSQNATSLVVLNNTTVSHNRAVNGAGIASSFTEVGSSGTLVVNINQSTIHDNATFASQGDQVGNGGGVLNINSTMNLVNSTVSGNQANGIPSTETDYSGLGGGILNAGSMQPAVTNLVHTTVSGNYATTTGGGLMTGLLDAAGAGSYTSLKNSIVAGNSATVLNANCSSQPDTVPNMFVSTGYNLDGDGTCNLNQPTDLPNTDPLLGPLADNGGDTLTHALLLGSPAIDAVPTAACPVLTDQRGISRPQGPACDIGAYEVEMTPELHVTKTVVNGIGIPNGGFEGGRVVWTESSALGKPVILNDAAVTPHGGHWAAQFGGYADEVATIEQQVTVPANAPYLVYWHWIESDDICGDNYDVASVRVNSAMVDQYYLCIENSTEGWTPHAVDLSAYAGQSVTLQIGAKTDLWLTSYLYVDDISFQPNPVPPPADAPSGGKVTYSIIVHNAGTLPAHGVTLTDDLPSGVIFDTGILTGSVVFPAPRTLTWGPWDVGAGETYVIQFTTSVTDSQSYYGHIITNTVDYASTDAGSGRAEAAFRIGMPQLSVTKSVVGPSVPVSLPNGDFESGVTVWTEYSYWGYDLITDTTGLPEEVTPHSGNWAAWLGGADDETAYIEQQVTVPASDSRLVYWHWIYSEDICGYDFGSVRVDGTVVDQYDLCEDENTDGWVRHVVDLSAYAGQTVTLQIRAETDYDEDGSYSSLYVDDVSFLQPSSADDTELGGVVTYTIAIQNSGTDLARGVVFTDSLPPGVTFATGIMTGSVVLPTPNTLAWGPYDVEAGASHIIRFTANVTDSTAFAGKSITNTVKYTASNASGGSSQAVFSIAGQAYHYVYLPLIKK